MPFAESQRTMSVNHDGIMDNTLSPRLTKTAASLRSAERMIAPGYPNPDTAGRRRENAWLRMEFIAGGHASLTGDFVQSA
jgi:hypothetical protein